MVINSNYYILVVRTAELLQKNLSEFDLGKFFVHRNIANKVINIDLNTISVIEYAVVHLKVNHIAIYSHYLCVGVKSAMQSSNLGLLKPWLLFLHDVYRLHKEELNKIKNFDKKYDHLVVLNVQEQCVNLIKTAVFQKA